MSKKKTDKKVDDKHEELEQELEKHFEDEKSDKEVQKEAEPEIYKKGYEFTPAKAKAPVWSPEKMKYACTQCGGTQLSQTPIREGKKAVGYLYTCNDCKEEHTIVGTTF